MTNDERAAQAESDIGEGMRPELQHGLDLTRERARQKAARSILRLREFLTTEAKTIVIHCLDCAELDAFEHAFGEATQRLVETHTLASLSPEIGWWALAQLHPDPHELGAWIYLARRATLRLQQGAPARPMIGAKRG